MMSTEQIIKMCTDPLDCQRVARANLALHTIQESEDKKQTCERIIDFFNGFARGYDEAVKAVKRGDIKI